MEAYFTADTRTFVLEDRVKEDLKKWIPIITAFHFNKALKKITGKDAWMAFTLEGERFFEKDCLGRIHVKEIKGASKPEKIHPFTVALEFLQEKGPLTSIDNRDNFYENLVKGIERGFKRHLDALSSGNLSLVLEELSGTSFIERLQRHTPDPRPIGITMGCPAGIGPEIIIKAFYRNPGWILQKRALVFGDERILERAQRVLSCRAPLVDPDSGIPGIPIRSITNLDPEKIPFGKATHITGMSSFEYVRTATMAAIKGEVGAVVTAPITKEGLKLADIGHPGHTEILAELTKTKDYAMMLKGERLSVVLVTIHCALRDVPGLLQEEKVLGIIRITHRSLKLDFGIDEPRIAVAGLNPHAGEGGLFGDEEERIISPAIKRAQKEGISCHGPFPPDTIFYRAAQGEFDAVVAQYHDQGLIPLKLLHFRDGVNVTLNLPIVRTSVDHGTAYDIAGKGLADPRSLEAAFKTAQYIIKCRMKSKQ